MAEDTWALNEGAIDEDAFLQQAYLTYDEREAMFFSALDRTRAAWWPASSTPPTVYSTCFFVLMAKRWRARACVDRGPVSPLDALVGKTLPYVDAKTALFVLSDHGFSRFARGVNLNAWLQENGYLAVKDDAQGRDYLKDVDWSRTRAYTFGLAGIYINQKGRESKGIVEPGAAWRALKAELAREADWASRRGTRSGGRPPCLDFGFALHRPVPRGRARCHRGLRRRLPRFVGRGRRQGHTEVFEDNRKAWSGDHCVDPHLVPGVLLSISNSRPKSWHEDMAPTAPDLFGVTPPPHMEGTSVLSVARTLVQSEVPPTRGLGPVALALVLAGCSNHTTHAGKSMIVLGIDGMDPEFLEAHWSSLPNLNRLRQTGDFRRLATTMPRKVRSRGPRSPPVWIPAAMEFLISFTAIPATRLPILPRCRG